MPFIGNQPAEKYSSFQKQDFTTSATTSYTLDHPVANGNELALFINFVRQEPTTAYTASGTTLTLTSATASSDDMYCVFLGKAVQTVNPPSGSVGSSQVASTIITGQTAETSIATDDTVLIHDTSAGALRKMTRANFVSGVGGTNTPAFSAYSSVDRSISNTTATLVAANAENFDTDSAYDTSTYKFTPGVAGKYFLYFRYFYTGTFSSTIRGYIYKNGSDVAHNDFTHIQSDNGGMISTIVTSDTDDYFQAYTYQNSGSSRNIVGGSTLIEFGGYKLIGV